MLAPVATSGRDVWPHRCLMDSVTAVVPPPLLIDSFAFSRLHPLRVYLSSGRRRLPPMTHA